MHALQSPILDFDPEVEQLKCTTDEASQMFPLFPVQDHVGAHHAFKPSDLVGINLAVGGNQITREHAISKQMGLGLESKCRAFLLRGVSVNHFTKLQFII